MCYMANVESGVSFSTALIISQHQFGCYAPCCLLSYTFDSTPLSPTLQAASASVILSLFYQLLYIFYLSYDFFISEWKIQSSRCYKFCFRIFCFLLLICDFVITLQKESLNKKCKIVH